MENSQLQGGGSSSGDDAMQDPEVLDLVDNLARLRHISDRRLTVPEQSQIQSKIIDQKEARKRASQDDIMAEGNAQFDEEAMQEAVRATKRRRIVSKFDLSGAHRMYFYGPEEQPADDDNNLDDFALDTEILGLTKDFNGAHSSEPFDLSCVPDTSTGDVFPKYKPGFDLLESTCSSVWFAVEVAKHLRPKDIVCLYSISKTFHQLLNDHWQSSIFAWAEYMAPSSFRIFHWKFFGRYARLDPAGTTWAAPGLFADAFPRPPWARPRPASASDNNIRSVPGLRYLAMVVEREIRVRDILAKLARSGHRLPKTCHESVKKIWMLMDLPTNTMRRSFIHNTQLWTGQDIYNAQMFIIKLQLRFNEPGFGPDSPILAETLLGSPHGLTPLWQMLRGKKYTELLEAMQMRVRYLVDADEIDRHARDWQKHYGVPRWQLGIGHLEGWGRGSIHLSRPDELVVEEAVRRGINLKDHLPFMMLWGHVNWQKRINLVPTEEELYMSDDELRPLTVEEKGPNGMFGKCGNVPFENCNWLPKHALQAKWDTLTEDEKLALSKDLEHDKTLMGPHEEDDEGFWNLDKNEMMRLNHRKKKRAVSAPNNLDSEADDESDDDQKKQHPDSCVCEGCAGQLGHIADGYDTDEHHDTCMCRDCLDQADFEAEEADYEALQAQNEESGADDDAEESDSEAEEAQSAAPPNRAALGLPTSDPMPEEALSSEGLRNAWDVLVPADQQMVNASIERQREEQAGLQPPAPIRQFPNITDLVSLALLHKLDGIQLDMPGESSQPIGEPNNAGVTDSTDDVEMDEQGENDNDAASNSSMDDEQLKALADEEYSDDELEFDMDNYKAFLAKAQDDGGFHNGGTFPGGDEDEDGFGMAHEADLKSPGAAIEMTLPDIINY
ncbi:hypothetical protein J7T55_001886 [Diaporthe amygdali]|uniref:uncharacterized protein n=1 Tax=Phomopsis amygdali TaxID=1214568 RepID=UPI0022FEEB5B|nr:uncharacterized protein J7T55_001886 [Diaporthe amygdali]KAJ0117687.1 hypothetical protein J7T55_001886 [Diaporthe amygdali]